MGDYPVETKMILFGIVMILSLNCIHFRKNLSSSVMPIHAPWTEQLCALGHEETTHTK